MKERPQAFHSQEINYIIYNKEKANESITCSSVLVFCKAKGTAAGMLRCYEKGENALLPGPPNEKRKVALGCHRWLG